MTAGTITQTKTEGMPTHRCLLSHQFNSFPQKFEIRYWRAIDVNLDNPTPSQFKNRKHVISHHNINHQENIFFVGIMCGLHKQFWLILQIFSGLASRTLLSSNWVPSAEGYTGYSHTHTTTTTRYSTSLKTRLSYATDSHASWKSTNLCPTRTWLCPSTPPRSANPRSKWRQEMRPRVCPPPASRHTWQVLYIPPS